MREALDCFERNPDGLSDATAWICGTLSVLRDEGRHPDAETRRLADKMVALLGEIDDVVDGLVARLESPEPIVG